MPMVLGREYVEYGLIGEVGAVPDGLCPWYESTSLNECVFTGPQAQLIL